MPGIKAIHATNSRRTHVVADVEYSIETHARKHAGCADMQTVMSMENTPPSVNNKSPYSTLSLNLHVKEPNAICGRSL